MTRAVEDGIAVSNSDSGRWLRLMADLEHSADADPFPSVASVETTGAAMEADTAALPQPNVGNEAPLTPLRGASSVRYEDYARERRIYELGGFGGPYCPPSGSLEL